MKKLLAVLVIAALAGGVTVQDAWCQQFYLGIFFSYNEATFDPYVGGAGVHPGTVYNPPTNTSFFVYVVVWGPTGLPTFNGYELTIIAPPETEDFFNMAWDTQGVGASIVRPGGYPGQGGYSIAHGYTSPREWAGHLSILRGQFRTFLPHTGQWRLGPFDELSTRPKVQFGPNELFAHLPVDGYDGGFAVMAATGGVVATENKTWTGIKSLFR